MGHMSEYRTVTTALELDTLPEGSVVLGDSGMAYLSAGDANWSATGEEEMFLTRHVLIDAPLTVIHTPDSGVNPPSTRVETLTQDVVDTGRRLGICDTCSTAFIGSPEYASASLRYHQCKS